MKFGIQIEPQFGFNYQDILDIAEAGLVSGFESLWFSDHFMLDADSTDRVLLDPWLVMAALVRDNRKIRVGSLVFCNNYRSPALHAKMAATLDVISNGRLEFGIGAGWKKMEYLAYGYEFPKFSIRREQLVEAIKIIKGAWTREKFTFEGKHYSVRNLHSFPKPVQKPYPPIWVGSNRAGSEMIELIAEHADGVNFAWGFGLEKTETLFNQLSEFAEKHGRDHKSIKRSIGLWTRHFKSEEEMNQKIVEVAEKRGISEEEYKERTSQGLWGTSDMMIETLRGYKALDVSHIILMLPHGEEIDHVKRIGKEVITKL